MAHLRPLVLSPTRLYVYWEAAEPGPFALRCSDLSGRPTADSLDGMGWRLLPVEAGAGGAYLEALPPGHVLWVELGTLAGAAFLPLAAARPVQMPWSGPVPLPQASAGQVSRS